MLPMFPPEYFPQAPPPEYPQLLPLPPTPIPQPLPPPPVLPLPPPENFPVQAPLPSFQLPPVQTQIPSPVPPPYPLPSVGEQLPRCTSCSSQPAPCPSCAAKAQNVQPPQQISSVLPQLSLQSLPRCSSCSGAAAPCSSCAAKAQASALPSNPLQTSSQLQSGLPRCSSCAGSLTPCRSCASKAQANPGDFSSLTDYSYCPVAYPDGNFIPADAVSQQLAYKARQEEKIKIEGEIAYGFKTLPIELDQIVPSKERYPEEALFQFNGQVMEFLPEKLVLSKAFDPYKGSEVLVAAKVPTPTKKLSLPEIGFGP
ncbi:proline-rich receptor-like protein kinase PERK2, partial [Agrilus planipennis]